MEKNKEEKTSLKIAKMLLAEIQNKDELLEKLCIKEPTFYRYFNILKKCGFEIIRNKNDYQITRFKNDFDFSRDDYGIMAYCALLANNMLPNRKSNIFNKVIHKISVLTNQKSYKEILNRVEFYKYTIMPPEFKEKIAIFDECIKQEKKVKILTKSNVELEILPIKFDWNKTKIMLNYLNQEDKMRVISIGNIVKIINIEDSFSNDAKETIFELYGKLIKSYVLKSDERIIDINNEKLVIANYNVDKKTLFRRLLRYDSLCRVVFPKTDVAEFKNMINSTLEMLECTIDSGIKNEN